jgi:hypothetical protein
MSKRTYFITAGSFLGGLLLGIGLTYFFSTAHCGKQIEDTLALIKDIETVGTGHRAFEAYKHNSPPVAIYALNLYLDSLKKAEEMGGGLLTGGDLSFTVMLAHARLAKVYAESGQFDLSTQHVAIALARATQDRKFRAITNAASLAEIVARLDHTTDK